MNRYPVLFFISVLFSLNGYAVQFIHLFIFHYLLYSTRNVKYFTKMFIFPKYHVWVDWGGYVHFTRLSFRVSGLLSDSVSGLLSKWSYLEDWYGESGPGGSCILDAHITHSQGIFPWSSYWTLDPSAFSKRTEHKQYIWLYLDLANTVLFQRLRPNRLARTYYTSML